MIAVTVVRALADLSALAAEWDALVLASPRATPFQTAAWCVSWTEHMAIADPAVLAVRDGRALVAVAPLFVWGPPAERTVSLLGAGISDHLDLLAAPGFERAALDAVRDWLDTERRAWTRCAFDEIGPAALLRELSPPADATLSTAPQSVCPVLSWRPGDALGCIVPPRQAACLRQDQRRARELGGSSVERARGDRVPAVMEILFALHRRRWTERGEPGLLADANICALHLEASRRLDAIGALRLYLLSIGGRPGAVIYGFRAHERVYLYLSGIEPDLQRASPGTLAVAAVLEDALAEGVRSLDFLRGRERYKYAWGAVDEPNVRITCARPTDDADGGR